MNMLICYVRMVILFSAMSVKLLIFSSDRVLFSSAVGNGFSRRFSLAICLFLRARETVGGTTCCVNNSIFFQILVGFTDCWCVITTSDE